MKQILQNLANGETIIEEIPEPMVQPGCLQIATRRSIVSAGTERMLLEFGRAGWIEKARQQPDKVRQVLDKVRTDGIAPTVEAVRSKLAQPLPMGYCNAGVVIAVGEGVSGFAVGDRVASNGSHAEVVNVPMHLCARIPDGVDDESAAATVLGAISLQGIRLAAPTLGESFVVIGLGLIGLLAVQLLRAHGCRVMGIDPDPSRCALAAGFGAEVAAGADVVPAARAFSRGRGVDGVVIAAATASSEPVSHAARMCRKRGRIVLVGVTGLALSRADFYEKELTFQVSCSYGPGRYDPLYEDRGHDYPVGFVRWTEQRNFEAVLDMMSSGEISIKPLISHRVHFAEAQRAYALLGSGETSLGIVLEYPERESSARLASPFRRDVLLETGDLRSERAALRSDHVPRVGFIGAGNHGGRVLMPAFHRAGARLEVVASRQGTGSVHFGRRHGFHRASSDPASVVADPTLDAVVIATRHDSHARYAVDAMRAGRHVFVEKPLCLSHAELQSVGSAWRETRPGPILMVGFNRRFAPHVVRMRSLLEDLHQPLAMVMTVNAGTVPADHWTRDRRAGGGRIVGEACHFIDLLRFLAGSPIDEATIQRVPVGDDTATIQLRFGNGSIGTVHYFTNGHRAFPKERLEVFAGGRVLSLDNFRRLRGIGWSGFRRMNLWRQDKGQMACVAAFVAAVRSGRPSPIPIAELLEVSSVCLDLAG